MEHPVLDLEPWMHLVGPLRAICLPLPEAHEGTSFGAPWFRAGKKPFAIFELAGGRPNVSFRAVPEARDELLTDPRFFPTPYMHQHGWVSLYLDGDVDWDEVEELLVDSYRLQALKRMLRALEQ